MINSISSCTAFNINVLPQEILGEITSHLPPEGACALKRTCSLFYKLFDNLDFMKQVMQRNWEVLILASDTLKKNPELQAIAFKGANFDPNLSLLELDTRDPLYLCNNPWKNKMGQPGELYHLFQVDFFRKDLSVANDALDQDIVAFTLASSELQNNKGFILGFFKKFSPSSLIYNSPSEDHHKPGWKVRPFIYSFYVMFRSVSDPLKADPEVIEAFRKFLHMGISEFREKLIEASIPVPETHMQNLISMVSLSLRKFFHIEASIPVPETQIQNLISMVLLSLSDPATAQKMYY